MKNKILKSAVCATLTLFLVGCSSDNYDFITLSEYKGVQIQSIQEINIEDSAVTARIDSILASNITQEEITDRSIQENDIVNLNLHGTVDGLSFPNGDLDGYALMVGSESLVEGFDESIIGKNIGDKFTVKVEFPSNHHSAEIAGKEVVYEVEINNIRIQITPKLTDEFVTTISDTANTVEELKLEVRKTLEVEESTTNITSLQTQAWNQIMSDTVVGEIPTSMLNDEISRIENQYLNMAELAGLTLSEYVSLNLGVDAETFKQQNINMAEYNIKERGTIYLIARAEGLIPTEEQYNTHYQSLLSEYGFNSIEALLSTVDVEDLQTSILSRLVKTFIIDNAVQTDK